MIKTLDELIAYIDTFAAEIPQIDPDTNFWMFRSKQGAFYDEFIKHRYIAIGWNALLRSVLEDNPVDESLKAMLKEGFYQDKKPGSAVNKCRRFVEDVKANDIGMIVGSREIAFVQIGDYYEEITEQTTVEMERKVHEQIEIRDYNNLHCPYSKRRYITILSQINIDNLPTSVYKCFVSNRHSLSSLNEYAEAILSCCYDLVYYSNKLILKYHIRQPRDINPIDFSLFTLSVASLLTDDSSSISGRYNINSEGDIILLVTNLGKEALSFLQQNLLPIVLIHFALFGGKIAGMEIPSCVEKVKEWITDFQYRKENRRIKAADAKKAESEARMAEAKAEKEWIEVERMRKASEYASKTVDDLRRAAVPLDIKPTSTLIDFPAPPQKEVKSEE